MNTKARNTHLLEAATRMHSFTNPVYYHTGSRSCHLPTTTTPYNLGYIGKCSTNLTGSNLSSIHHKNKNPIYPSQYTFSMASPMFYHDTSHSVNDNAFYPQGYSQSPLPYLTDLLLVPFQLANSDPPHLSSSLVNLYNFTREAI